MKEVGEKRGELAGLDVPVVGGGTETEVWLPYGAVVWDTGETFEAESKAADLWQSKWNESQTVLAAATATPDRDVGPLQSTAAGSWRQGWQRNPRGRAVVDC